MDLENAQALEYEIFGKFGKMSGAREGVMAFLEKRDPNWEAIDQQELQAIVSLLD